MKANLSYILLFFSLFCFETVISQTIPKDSTLLLTKRDSLILKEKDSILTDSIKKPKEVIDGIITHDAEDYTLQNSKEQTLTLYNNARINYDDVDLTAGKIIVDYKKNTVYAKGIVDSTGYTQKPIFKQGSQESEQDSILFNFKTEKALIYGVKTLQGEMIAYGEKNKRVNDSTIYMQNLKFTTSEKKRPDYYIATDKAKLIPGKKIVVGASNLVLADVPTPLYLPFGYFPLTKGTTSGIIMPTFGENSTGISLQNGGYYFAISDYIDLQVLGSIFSNGSWNINPSSFYKKRYKFSGNFSFNYQNNVTSIRGFDDYSKRKIYNISWTHRQDNKSSPNSSISASVNLGSTSYFQESINQLDQSDFLTNTTSSSISYSKTFVGTPFNMSASMNHSQSSSTGVINMSLPTVQLNMQTQYPFAGKGGIKKNPIQKMGFSYTMNGQYKFTTNDDEFFTSKMFREGQKGIRHKTGTSTNIKMFNYFTLTPNINYEEVWYFDRIEKYFNPDVESSTSYGEVVNDTINGFRRFNEYNGGVGLSTTAYGIVNFKNSKLKSIRHTVIPSVSWSYTPDFYKKHQLRVRKSSNAGDIETYTPYDNGIYNGPASGISNSLTFSLKNKLEAKVAPKENSKSEEEEDRKITLLNNLNFSSGYNMAADSLGWSDLRASASTRILKEKLNLSLNANFDPYQVTDEGDRINKFNRNILRLETVSLTSNFSLSSSEIKDWANSKNTEDSSIPPDVYGAKINPTEIENENRGKQDNKEEVTSELYKADIAWDISFNYGLSYSDNGYGDKGISNHTVGISGNIEPSPKWKIGFSSPYDFVSKKFSHTRLNFSRDLDSWKINFNWTDVFGDSPSYTFFIGIKSSLLSDLKWEKIKPSDKILF